MNESILNLPDDLLLHIFSNYVSINDLYRLEQVCRRFRDVLYRYSSPWQKVFNRGTNVTFSRFKNAIGCPTIENVRRSTSIFSHRFDVPVDYQYEILFDRPANLPPLLSDDQRRPFNHSLTCNNNSCDINRLRYDYRYLTKLASRWKHPHGYRTENLVRFVRRAQTSLIYYDEHNRQLWFTHDRTLRCLDMNTHTIVDSWEFFEDDVLCYKIYDDQFLCLANGSSIRVICRQTRDIHVCQLQEQPLSQIPAGERCDVLSMDVYSNDRQRYLVLTGSRDHTVSMRSFDMSTQTSQFEWCTKVFDRVLCTRFTPDGRHVLIGTGATSNAHPLVLFNTERAQPVHLYNARYRFGAGVRCIEWASPNVFIAAGFDSQYNEFDLRTGKPHYTFYDPHDNDYCSMAVSANFDDTGNGIVLGCNRYSTVRLVNRRQRALQHVFYVTKEASPVHSLAVTSEMLFASMDRSIVALNFTRRDDSTNQQQCLNF